MRPRRLFKAATGRSYVQLGALISRLRVCAVHATTGPVSSQGRLCTLRPAWLTLPFDTTPHAFQSTVSFMNRVFARTGAAMHTFMLRHNTSAGVTVFRPTYDGCPLSLPCPQYCKHFPEFKSAVAGCKARLAALLAEAQHLAPGKHSEQAAFIS